MAGVAVAAAWPWAVVVAAAGFEDAGAGPLLLLPQGCGETLALRLDPALAPAVARWGMNAWKEGWARRLWGSLGGVGGSCSSVVCSLSCAALRLDEVEVEVEVEVEGLLFV